MLLLLLSACKEEKYVGLLAHYPGEKQGTIKSYDEQGNVHEIGEFKDGKLHGTRKIHFTNGIVEIEETYKAGVFHGSYTKNYPSGKNKISGDYVEGTMEGIWKTFYESGELKDEVTMKDNLENGPFKEYYQNGNKKAIGTYLKGENEHGPLQLFDDSGTLIKKMNCVEGICRTTWTIDGGDVTN